MPIIIAQPAPVDVYSVFLAKSDWTGPASNLKWQSPGVFVAIDADNIRLGGNEISGSNYHYLGVTQNSVTSLDNLGTLQKLNTQNNTWNSFDNHFYECSSGSIHRYSTTALVESSWANSLSGGFGMGSTVNQSNGNIYYLKSNATSQPVREITLTKTDTLQSGGFTDPDGFPRGLARDSSGNFYTAGDDGTVLKLTPGGIETTYVTVSETSNNMQDVACDTNTGVVYATDSAGTGNVYRITGAGSYSVAFNIPGEFLSYITITPTNSHLFVLASNDPQITIYKVSLPL